MEVWMMCEFCNKQELGSRPISDRFKFKIPIETIIDDTFLYNYCDCGHHTVLEIKYCPMCGRKLTEEENGVEMKPVIHAHAIIDWLGTSECSNCGSYIDSTEPYCQHCGAALHEPEERI